MNYFELHIGDYDKATAHLTACEDGIYGRLMRRYYDTEAPLPNDIKALQRFVRARSRDEKEAVQTILDEFFHLQADGWHHKRCDEEIAEYRDAHEEKDLQRTHERERKRRYRQRRAELFEQLREHGIVPKFDTPIDALEAELSRVLSHGTSAGTNGGTGRGRPENGTAIHSPLPTSHIPREKQTEASTHTEGARDDSSPTPTEEGRACLLMRQAGCDRTNPSHPDLIAAMAEGVPPEALAHTAAEAVRLGRTNPFTWAIATARSRHAEGPKPIGGSHANSPQGSPRSAVERVAAANAAARYRDEESSGLPPIEGTVRVIAT